MFKFIKAAWFKHVTGRSIWWIFLHTIESGETVHTAEDTAHWFAGLGPERKVSAHYCADPDTIVQCVKDGDVAYAAPGANSHGLHIEMAGRAAQGAVDWHDQQSQDMLRLVERLVADKCKELNIPVRKLTATDLKQGKRGIAGHIDATHAFGGSHTDPGANFPWDEFIVNVQRLLDPEDLPKQIDPGLWSGLKGNFWALYNAGLPPDAMKLLNKLRDHPFFPPRT